MLPFFLLLFLLPFFLLLFLLPFLLFPLVLFLLVFFLELFLLPFLLEPFSPFSLFCALLLGRDQYTVDVGQDAALRERHVPEQLVEFLVVPHAEHDVAGRDARALVVTRSVAGELQDLGSEVLHHGGYVNWGAAAQTRRVHALPQEATDAADGELQSRTA